MAVLVNRLVRLALVFRDALVQRRFLLAGQSAGLWLDNCHLAGGRFELVLEQRLQDPGLLVLGGDMLHRVGLLADNLLLRNA